MSILETNIRVVDHGSALYLNVRHMRVSGQGLEPDLLERACSHLRRRWGLAAVPDPDARDVLIVVSTRPVPSLQLTDDEWEIKAEDVSDSPSRLYARDCPDEVTTLVERSLLARVARISGLWTLDSPRIWYEESPFRVEDGVYAYRRYELATMFIDGVGVGVIADIGTAFFSQHNLSYFFDPRLDESERRKRRREFNALSGRPHGQKGTLRYDSGRSVTRCYLEDVPEGLTCGTTGTLVVRGQTYESLFEYYGSVSPDLNVAKDEPVVRVSFPNLSRPQLVAARLLSLRISNDRLPRRLSSEGSVSPAERRTFLTRFWKTLEPAPLGRSVPRLREGFWRPPEGKSHLFELPALEFGNAKVLESPRGEAQQDLRSNYRERLRMLGISGCYQFPAAAERTVHVAYPRDLEESAVRVADDVAEVLSGWTTKRFGVNPVCYDTPTGAYSLLNAIGNGLVLFILEDEPAAYYETSFNLPGWRVKRITRGTLIQQYNNLTSGVWDRRRKSLSHEAGRRRWSSFIRLNALDVLQLLDAVPFRTEHIGVFESQLVIDVGRDRKFFAVSLLITRENGESPIFRIHTNVQHKPDNNNEIINSALLKDAIIETFERAIPKGACPLRSLLVVRDGRLQRNEIRGLDEAISVLREDSFLARESRVDIVGLYKSSLKNIRMWSVGRNGISNVLEGTGISLNPDTFVFCSTGDATLRQGTASPIAIVGNGHHRDLSEAAYSSFASAQLNWSSPDVAQRLPLPMKRTDEELNFRMSQEIRRIR